MGLLGKYFGDNYDSVAGVFWIDDFGSSDVVDYRDIVPRCLSLSKAPFLLGLSHWSLRQAQRPNGFRCLSLSKAPFLLGLSHWALRQAQRPNDSPVPELVTPVPEPVTSVPELVEGTVTFGLVTLVASTGSATQPKADRSQKKHIKAADSHRLARCLDHRICSISD